MPKIGQKIICLQKIVTFVKIIMMHNNFNKSNKNKSMYIKEFGKFVGSDVDANRVTWPIRPI